MAQLVTLDEHLKKRKPNGRRRSGGDEGPRHGPTREQLVAAMNEKYCWLDDEKAIFDLQYFVTRKREQVIIDMALLSAVEFVNGREKTVSALSAWMTSKDRLVYSGRKFLPGQGPFATEFKGKPLGGTFVNLWRGWGCEPVKGDVSPFINLVKRLCDSKCVH